LAYCGLCKETKVKEDEGASREEEEEEAEE